MKDYKQVSDSVFRKAEERMNEKKRRAAMIWRNSLVASGMAAVLLVGVGIWKNEDIRNALKWDRHSSEVSVIDNETGTTSVSATNETTEASTSSNETTTAKTSKAKTTTTSAATDKTSSGSSKTTTKGLFLDPF